jgi:hypothetical protein
VVNGKVLPDPLPPYPCLTAVRPPRRLVGARVGETLSLSGTNLDGDSVQALVMTSRWAQPVTLAAQRVSSSEVAVTLPAKDPAWFAGQYAVSAVFRQGLQPRATNELPWSLSPRIDNIVPPNPQRDKNGQAAFKVMCSPAVGIDQRASILLAGRELVLPPRAAAQQSLDVAVGDVPAGAYPIRLRVDGVDSEMVDRSVSPPVFDATQVVTIR